MCCAEVGVIALQKATDVYLVIFVSSYGIMVSYMN